MMENSVWFLKWQTDGTPTPETELWFRQMNRLKRWGDIPMIHRSSLFDHLRRVSFLARYIGMMVYTLEDDEFNHDETKIGRLAYHHDDEEPLTKDLPSDYKREMSAEQKQALDREEELARSAIGHFVLNLPHPEQELYIADRHEVRDKQTTESQIVEVADKLDAYGEILHEIRCGNERFLDFLSLRFQIINELNRFKFWVKIKDDPNLGLTTLPKIDDIGSLPKISVDSFQKRDDIPNILLEGDVSE